MANLTKETPRISKYIFSPEQLMRAKMLSQETIAYFEHQAADIALELLTVEFSGDPKQNQEQIYMFIALQSRYRFLLETLNETADTYQQMATP